MWSSVHENNKSNSNRLVSSSSSASKTYSSSSSSSLPQTPRRRNMDEVWKDISLTTLHHEGPFTPSIRIESHHHLQAPCFRGMILQDFLAGAFKETSTADGTPLLPPPPPPLPHTALRLSSGMGFQPFGSSMIHNSCTTCSNSSSNSSGSHAHQPQLFVSETVVGSPLPAGIYSCSKKRELESSNSEGDPRHKRMIKNRESAARSRARKQAYTNELELEVTHLQEENAKLRKERDELRSAMASQQTPKNTLKRSSSAPF